MLLYLNISGYVDHRTVTMMEKESPDYSFVPSRGTNLQAGSALYHLS